MSTKSSMHEKQQRRAQPPVMVTVSVCERASTYLTKARLLMKVFVHPGNTRVFTRRVFSRTKV